MSVAASRILMVRPRSFGFNPETAASNAFQKQLSLDRGEISRRALVEFDLMAEGLARLGVEVLVLDEPVDSGTPDAVFPNNWFSTHPDRTLCLYPMEAPARRLERRLLAQVLEELDPKRVVDLTGFESQNRFLEGTGSLILDHAHKIAFACRSSRTHAEVLEQWSNEMGFETVVFNARDRNGMEIYHTNVMMCLGTGFGVVCIDAINDTEERANFLDKFHQTGRELVEISHGQMESFAGNMLQLSAGENLVLVMSETARKSLTLNQLETLESFSLVSSFEISTIETCGGGSVRCMIAELF